MATNWINANGGDWNVSLNWDNGVPSTTNQALINSDVLSANGKSITLSALAQCMGLVITGSKTFTISSAVYGLELYGDFVGSTNCTFAMTGTAYVYSKATQTIMTNGKTLAWNRWYIDTVGGTVTNGDDYNITGNIYLANGTWNTNQKNISGYVFTTIAGTKTLTTTNSVMTFNSWAGGSSGSGLTFNYNGSTIKALDPWNYGAFQGNTIMNNIEIGSPSGFTTGLIAVYPFTCNNLIINGKYGGGIAVNIIVTNILTISGANATSQRVLIQSNTIGTQRSLTFDPAKAIISNADFQDINCPNAIDLSTNTTVGNCGGNSGITFPPAIDCFIKHTSGAMSVSNADKWVTTDGGSTQARVPLPQDRAWGKVSSFTGASTVTMDCPRIGSIDLSEVNQPVTWALGNAIAVYKSYRMGSYITQTGNFLISYFGDRSANGSVYLGSNHPNNFNVILSNTFNQFTIEKGQKVQFTAGTTQTVSNVPVIDGTSAFPTTVKGVTAAEFTLNYTGTSWIQCDWLNLTNCKVLPVGKWFAGKNSVNNGGNTNWLFRRYNKNFLIINIMKE